MFSIFTYLIKLPVCSQSPTITEEMAFSAPRGRSLHELLLLHHVRHPNQCEEVREEGGKERRKMNFQEKNICNV